MVNGRAVGVLPGLYLDLRTLPPIPQRLLEIVDLAGGCGFRRLALDWGASFPWSLDERFRAAYAYPEEVVAGLATRATGLGMELVQVAPALDSLDFVYHLPAYRHLFHVEGGRAELDLAGAGGLKLYEDLVEELLELPAGCRDIALSLPSSVLPVIDGWRSELAGRGVRVEPLVVEQAPSEALARGNDEDTARARGLRPTTFLSLQPPFGSPSLRGSIELSLDLLADAAPASDGAAGEGHRGEIAEEAAGALRAREMLGRLEGQVMRAWGEIRATREALACCELAGDREVFGLGGRMERLEEELGVAERAADGLRRLLGGRIEAESLEAALGSMVEPIREELHLLIPRVHLVERRAGRIGRDP